MKHPIEIAKEKFANDQDITVCQVVRRTTAKNCGIIYKGLFYSDCYLDDTEGQAAYVIEDDDGKGINIFTPNGTFAARYSYGFGRKVKIKQKG